jgi:uncharacterized protein YukE
VGNAAEGVFETTDEEAEWEEERLKSAGEEKTTARILVTLEQIHSAGQESEQMVQRLEGTMINLSPTWGGMTAQRFYGDYENWRNQMR